MMPKKVAILFLLSSSAMAQSPAPRNGFIPDATTAIRVAEAVLTPIYSAKQIEGERPFHAAVHNGVWTVSGSLPDGWVGGVATILIDKNSGAILSYIHGK